MPRDQADDLRHLAQRAQRQPTAGALPPRFLAVSSGKGGVGTSTVAVNLAVALGLAGHRVVLVDADPNRADVSALCGLVPPAGIAELLDERRDIHEVVVGGPAGILVVPGPWTRREACEPSPAAQDRLLRGLEGMGQHAEVVVLDVGAGLNRFVRRFWQRAELVLAVTTGDPVPLMDTYAAIKVLLGEGSPACVRLVVNRALDAPQAEAVAQRLVRACRRFLGLRVAAAGWLPDDPALARACRDGVPLLVSPDEGPAGSQIEHLAAEVWSTLATRPLAATGRLHEGQWTPSRSTASAVPLAG